MPVLEAYGMTEASHQMASNPLPPAARKPGSVGVPTGAEIRHRRRATAGRCRRARPGEVVIRGPGRHRRLPQQPRGERRGVLRRLVPDGRPRRLRRRRLPPARGPAQGDDPPRRREHLARTRSRRSCSRTRPSPTRSASGSTTRSTASASARPWRSRGDADERELIDHCRERLAAFKVPEVDPRPRRDPAHADRQGAAQAGRRPRSRRTPREVRGPRRRRDRRLRRRRARPRRQRRDADRPRRAPARDAGATACGC